MTNIDDGVFSLPRAFHRISSQAEKAYILSRRCEIIVTRGLLKRVPTMLQTDRFNPLLFKMNCIIHYANKSKNNCSHI